MTGNFWKPGTAAAQEINVKQATTDVLHNTTYDFQNVLFSSTKDIVFTIENKGSAALNLTGTPRVNVTSGGANFSVTVQPSVATLAGGATTTFTVRFTPVSNGLKTGTISIANNDTDENPYIINLTGTGTPTATSSEISVSQNAVNINTGGSYNFGNVTQNATTYALFTIANSGDGPLNLTSTSVTGAGYSIDLAPVSPVAVAGSTTFRVRLNPTSTGTFNGTVTIVNNDPDEASFTISLTATVTNCATSITNTSVLQDYDANNNLANPWLPTGGFNAAFANPFPTGLNTSYTVAKYDRLATGTYDVIRYNTCAAYISIPAGKPLISMLVYSPVVGKSIILDLKNAGGTSVRAVTMQTTKANQWERIYFDMSPIVGNTTATMLDIMIDPTPAPGVARTYYIDDIRYDVNPCIADLPASEIFNDYDDHRNVSLVFNPTGAFNSVFANPYSGGLNTSATVARYDRLATGTYDVIRYGACSGGTIDLTGKTTISFLIYSPIAGKDVIMSLKNAGGTEVAAITTKITVANAWQRLYFDFESIKNNSTVAMFDIMIDPTPAPGVARTYHLDDIRYDINPCYNGISTTGVMQDYDNNRFLNMTNANAAFNDLTANPSATGINTSATVGRLNRPATGLYNLIRYSPCGTNFDLSPGKTVYAMDVYSPVANTRVYMTLKLANGTTTLVEDSALVTTANTWQTLTFDFSSQLSSNLGAFLDIYLDPNIEKGAQTYYIDNIRFGAAAPEINVRQGITNILTGGSFDMGSINVGSSSSDISFNIQNNGTGNLNLSGSPIVAISGANAADFVINQTTTISSVGPVSSTSFTVTFSPSASGTRTAILSIANNDANENPYIINLTGTGVCALVGATGTITGTNSLCSGTTGVVYTIPAVTNATNYTWTVPTGASITAGAGSTSITVTFGTTSGNVTVTPSNVCGNGTMATRAITVNPPASAAGAITGATTACSGQTNVAYSITAVSGATGYTWTAPAGASITGSGTSITVNFGSTSGNVTVTPTSACGNGTASSTTVTLSGSANPAGAITGSTTECNGATGVAYSITAVSGATGYTWTVPTGATITGSGTAITVNFGSTSGNVTVTPTSTCGSGAAASLAVTVNLPASAAGTITGPTSVCNGATGQAYSIATVSNATGYNWTVPAGASITGSGTSITVNFGSTSGNVTVTPTAACGNGTMVSKAVTIDNGASAAGSITGPSSACNGATGLVYSITSVSGASGYTWSVPSGSTITSGGTSTSMTMTFGGTAGNVTVTPTAACGNGTSSNLSIALETVTCTPPPVQTISGPKTPTTGQTVTYSVSAPPSGTTYSWTFPSGTTVVSNTPDNSSVTVTIGPNSGNVTLTATNPAGSTNSTLPITVSPATGLFSSSNATESYTVSPLPFEYSTTVRINSTSEGSIKLKVVDTRGVVVYSSTDHVTNQDIVLGEELKSGIYYVEALYQNKVQVFKLVKR